MAINMGPSIFFILLGEVGAKLWFEGYLIEVNT